MPPKDSVGGSDRDNIVPEKKQGAVEVQRWEPSLGWGLEHVLEERVLQQRLGG